MQTLYHWHKQCINPLCETISHCLYSSRFVALCHTILGQWTIWYWLGRISQRAATTLPTFRGSKNALVHYSRTSVAIDLLVKGRRYCHACSGEWRQTDRRTESVIAKPTHYVGRVLLKVTAKDCAFCCSCNRGINVLPTTWSGCWLTRYSCGSKGWPGATPPVKSCGPLGPPPNETGCKVARLHNTCIYSVKSHSWCQITPFNWSCIMWRHPEFLPPSTPQIRSAAARNAPDKVKYIRTCRGTCWLRWTADERLKSYQWCHWPTGLRHHHGTGRSLSEHQSVTAGGRPPVFRRQGQPCRS